MGHLARRAIGVALAFVAPACLVYGRDDTKIVEVAPDASLDGGDDGVAVTDGGSVNDGAGGDGTAGDGGLLDGADTGHVAFVTLAMFVGGTIAANKADSVCANAALNHFNGKFKAWLSEGASGPAASFVDYGPWTTADGSVVARDLPSLLSGSVEHAIDIDETGAVWKTGIVWTGTAPNGTPSGNDCKGWTETSGTSVGTYGQVAATNVTWTNAGAVPCSQQGHVYCFAQP